MRIKKFIAFSLAALPFVCWAMAGQAASFDCTKAGTAVEKMICADAELSKLDEEMAAKFNQALPKSPDADYTTEQQKHWLRERNQCHNTDCLRQQYKLRLEELGRVIALVPLADTQESHVFKSEADKLLFMRDIVRRQDFLLWQQQEEAPFCETFLKDFVAGRDIEVLEPLFTTTDANDPRFAKLNQCVEYWWTTDKKKPLHRFERVELTTEVNPPGVAQPYRYYTLQPNGSPAMDTEMILQQKSGYALINIQDCLYEAGARGPYGRSGTLGSPVCNSGYYYKCDPALAKLYLFSALIRHQGKLLAVSIAPNLTSSTTPKQYSQERPIGSELKKEAVSYDFYMARLDKDAYRKGRTEYCSYPSYYGMKMFCEHGWVKDKFNINTCRKYNLLNN